MFHHQLRVSIEPCEEFSLNAPSHSEACFVLSEDYCDELILTRGVCHDPGIRILGFHSYELRALPLSYTALKYKWSLWLFNGY